MTQRTSDALCRAAVWVRRWRGGSCRSCRERDRAPACARVRGGRCHSAFGLTPLARESAQPADFAVGHNSAMAVGSASCHPGGSRREKPHSLGRDAGEGRGFCGAVRLAAPIKLKPEWFAERRKRPFGGIGFGGLERNVVHLAGGRAAAFTGAMALADDGCTVRLHGDPHPGDIDRQESAAVFPGEHTAGFDASPGSSRQSRRSGWLPRWRTSPRGKSARGHWPRGCGYGG